MKVKTIRFGYLDSFGNHQNCHIEEEAEVEKDEDPDVAYAKLKEQVIARVAAVAEKESRQYISEDLKRLEAQRDQLNAEVRKLAEAKYFEGEIIQVKRLVDGLSRRLEAFQPKTTAKKTNVIPSDAEEAAFDENDDEDG